MRSQTPLVDSKQQGKAPPAAPALRAYERPSGVHAAVKRCMDVVASLALLILLAPLMALIALAVRVDSRGPALFGQRRVGRGLETFTLLKFRTMHDGAPSDIHRDHVAWLLSEPAAVESRKLKKLTGDPRVTRVGAVLRRMSLDELPQLVNVLRGDMSLVGPRPAIEYELDHYAARDFDRFTVLPGMTGLWQVSGRSELGFREMLDLDVRYARQASLALDFSILVRTPVALVRGAA